MTFFTYQHNQLFAEACSLTAIAEQYGTPCYVYSRAALTQNWQAFDQACQGRSHRICYAVKANSSLAVLNILAKSGSGFDIVSGGELTRVLAAGGSAGHVVFSGVGKQPHEIVQALEAGIDCFNVESAFELDQINHIAGSLGKIAPIALRINPDIPIDSHPYIATGLKDNKFGIPFQEALPLYQHAKRLPHILIKGIACHLGSQIMEVSPFMLALKMLLALIDELAAQDIIITQLDLGGGFGASYTNENTLAIQEFIAPVVEALHTRTLTLLLEPGRAVAASAGILLTRVLSIKKQVEKNFAIVDAGMNDLIRPALYEAWHNIIPVKKSAGTPQRYDIVGPVCESGDFLGNDRTLIIQSEDLLAVTMAGAYGFTMSSNYNTRPRAAEIMVDGDKAYCVRTRETLAMLIAGETCLP